MRFPRISKKAQLVCAIISIFGGILISVVPQSASATYSPNNPPPLCSLVPEIGDVFIPDNEQSDDLVYNAVASSKFSPAQSAIQAQVLSALAANPTWIAGVQHPTGDGSDVNDYHLVIRIWDYPLTSSASQGISYGKASSSDTAANFIYHENDEAIPNITVRFYKNTAITDQNVFMPYTGYPHAAVSNSVTSWTSPTYPTSSNSLTRVIYPGSTAQIYSGFDCLVGSSNIYRYPKPYAQELPVGGLGAMDEEDGTSFWDSITGGIGDIVDFIKDMPQLLAALFVPDPSTISASTDEFTEFFDEKLGFLVWPFEFISNILQLFMGTGITDDFDDFGNTYNQCPSYGVSSTNAHWSFGSFFGSGVWINPCMFAYVMPTIWAFASIAARSLLVIAVVNFLLNAHRRHVK